MAEEVETDEGEHRIVARCMLFVPDHMNIKEGYNLMIMLYKIGILSTYLATFDAVFSDYFDFDNEYQIKLDSETGRVTFLSLYRYYFYDGDDRVLRPHVPPIIEHFQSLESIQLHNCQSLTVELGNLPILETILLNRCTSNMFENTPEGLRLPSIKKVTVCNSKFDTNLSSFLKTFSNNLEELDFSDDTTREQTDEILRVLQNGNLCCRQSLTTIRMACCELNDSDLKILMFDIRERFPKLHTIDVSNNDIKSVVGIEDRIKEIRSSSLSSSSSSSRSALHENNLRELNLNGNHVLKHIIIDNGNTDVTIDPKDKSAFTTLLDTFNRISSLGLDAFHCYSLDVEYALRINQAGRRFISDRKMSSVITTATTTTSTAPVIKHALWPMILERAYKKSNEIYNRSRFDSEEQRDKNKCVTGLFDLIRHYNCPILIDYRYRTRHDDNNNDNGNTNDRQLTTATTLKCKRKHSEIL